MRLRPILALLPHALAAVVVVTAIAGAAFAAPGAKKPSQLVVQKSDFPASAGARVLTRSGGSSGGYGGYGVTYAYRTGSQPNEISSSVLVLPSRAVAVAAFRELRDEMTKGVPLLRLPAYGDEQIANFSPLGGSQLVVRKNTVVWVLELQTFLTRDGRTHELTKAEATDEYKALAPKVKQRVGSG
jgi:hypothetical protein